MDNNKGFTLVELMVTLVVATILVGIAAPSLISLYEANRADSEIRRIQQALQLARNHAISYGSRVTVCPTTGGVCSNNWLGGFRVFTDGDTIGSFDGTDEIIKEVLSFNNKDHVKFTGNSITFTPDGLIPSNSSVGTLSYCPGSTSNDNSRSLTISISGRISFDKQSVKCT